VLGAEGVGIQGIFTTLVALASAIFGCSLANSGTQYIAKYADSDRGAFGEIYGTVGKLGKLLGFMAFVVLLMILYLLPIGGLVPELGPWSGVWLATGVMFAIILSAQRAQLNGTRQLAQLAMLNVGGAIAGILVIMLAIAFLGKGGLEAVFIAPYLSGCMIGYLLLRRVSYPADRGTGATSWSRKILGIGWVMTAGVIIVQATQLLVRLWLENRSDIETVGLFHAAWLFGMTYIGFLLSAMIAEYYPRLSAIADDTTQFCHTINSQIKLCLLVAPAIIVAAIIFSDQIVRILYTEKFAESANLLRYLLIGDVFKLIAWAMSIGLIVREKKVSFLFGEILWNILFFSVAVLLYNQYGLVGFGISYIVSYLAYFLYNLWRLYSTTGFYIERFSILYLCVVVGICLICLAIRPSGLGESFTYALLLVFYGIGSALVLRRNMDKQ